MNSIRHTYLSQLCLYMPPVNIKCIQQQNNDHIPPPEEHHAEPEPELLWEQLLEELPAAPPLQEASWPKVYKLARELKRRASLVTAGQDLHDIHTVIHTAAHWQHLQAATQHYTAHRMRLLYVAITKGWPAALFYDQQGGEEFLDVSPEFWATFQPPQRPRAAQHRPAQTRGRSATRRDRGEVAACLQINTNLLYMFNCIIIIFFYYYIYIKHSL
jgi:hypothetical protein